MVALVILGIFSHKATSLEIVRFWSSKAMVTQIDHKTQRKIFLQFIQIYTDSDRIFVNSFEWYFGKTLYSIMQIKSTALTCFCNIQ